MNRSSDDAKAVPCGFGVETHVRWALMQDAKTADHRNSTRSDSIPRALVAHLLPQNTTGEESTLKT